MVHLAGTPAALAASAPGPRRLTAAAASGRQPSKRCWSPAAPSSSPSTAAAPSSLPSAPSVSLPLPSPSSSMPSPSSSSSSDVRFFPRRPRPPPAAAVASAVESAVTRLSWSAMPNTLATESRYRRSSLATVSAESVSLAPTASTVCKSPCTPMSAKASTMSGSGSARPPCAAAGVAAASARRFSLSSLSSDSRPLELKHFLSSCFW
mmetsp:Transcript_9278/g.28887  ORF Transcript_9278/g.28887 Transcript_9278/m.28887 type:complete len:207 (+) Transcript_9278:973-1593(+)